VKAYIDRHRDAYGVEPICRVLQMAPSCYWRHAARQRNPQLRSARAERDEGLKADIQRVWHANWQVYGADKVWLQMNREGIPVARCTVERLMRAMGLQGARRGMCLRRQRRRRPYCRARTMSPMTKVTRKTVAASLAGPGAARRDDSNASTSIRPDTKSTGSTTKT